MQKRWPLQRFICIYFIYIWWFRATKGLGECGNMLTVIACSQVIKYKIAVSSTVKLH